MKKIQAIFENGIFRPTSDVDLPDQTEVEFEPRIIEEGSAETEHLDGVYSILAETFETDEPDLAERHNEHQP
jgi:predicted DNA-binding antitoxin AbrB/MazE fold protein